MSMKEYMHPRNIYRTPPDFKQMAIDYPEFRKYVKQELSGKVSLDFTNVEALRALTCTLLKKDFSLDVEIPTNKLIPTIPLRLNYILWIEDLLAISGTSERMRGIDIGTGASCVYPLLISKQYGWSMLATEIDASSSQIAQTNVERNNLSELITVKTVKGSSLVTEVISDTQYDFCMCNPPFFSSPQEVKFEFKSRKASRPRPKNAFCATAQETVVTGGEVDFVKKLISESTSLGTGIRIYTTMLGHKTSLPPLKKVLRENDVVSFKQTEFCQGNTTRWGLAWTFCDIDLRKVPEMTVLAARKQKFKRPFTYHIENSKERNISEVADALCDILKSLQIDFRECKRSKNVIVYDIQARSDTWSHQRRMRRARKRLESTETPPVNNNDESKGLDTLMSDVQLRSPGKRSADDDEGYYNSKKLRLTEDTTAERTACEFFMDGVAEVTKNSLAVHIELFWVNGTAGRDVMHQVLQYIKNNLK